MISGFKPERLIWALIRLGSLDNRVCTERESGYFDAFHALMRDHRSVLPRTSRQSDFVGDNWFGSLAVTDETQTMIANTKAVNKVGKS